MVLTYAAVAQPVIPLPDVSQHSIASPIDPPLKVGQKIAPEINRASEQNPEAAAYSQNKGDRSQSDPQSAATAITEASSNNASIESGGQTNRGEPDGIEYYVTAGYKFKISGFLMVLFTFLLVLAGGAQSRILRYTARALPTLERTYISIIAEIEPHNKTRLASSGEIIVGIGAYKVGFSIVNHGKTPAALLDVSFPRKLHRERRSFPNTRNR